MTEPPKRTPPAAPERLATGSADDTPRTSAPRRISAAELLGPDGIVCIEHDGQLYTLRRTRAGRLILTK
jgi:hemin uptake protein HemP